MKKTPIEEAMEDVWAIKRVFTVALLHDIKELHDDIEDEGIDENVFSDVGISCDELIEWHSKFKSSIDGTKIELLHRLDKYAQTIFSANFLIRYSGEIQKEYEDNHKDES